MVLDKVYSFLTFLLLNEIVFISLDMMCIDF